MILSIEEIIVSSNTDRIDVLEDPISTLIEMNYPKDNSINSLHKQAQIDKKSYPMS